MKKMILAALAATSVMAGATAASADIFTLTLPPPAGDGSISAAFGRPTGPPSNLPPITGAFTDTWNFTLPSGFESGSISSILTANSNNVNFTSVTLNGVPFIVDSTGAFESEHLLNSFTNGGPQVLVVSGVLGSGTGTGAYGGTIAFSPAVPEPATWALMIAGIGLAGGAIRMSRRRSQLTLA